MPMAYLDVLEKLSDRGTLWPRAVLAISISHENIL